MFRVRGSVGWGVQRQDAEGVVDAKATKFGDQFGGNVGVECWSEVDGQHFDIGVTIGDGVLFTSVLVVGKLEGV